MFREQLSTIPLWWGMKITPKQVALVLVPVLFFIWLTQWTPSSVQGYLTRTNQYTGHVQARSAGGEWIDIADCGAPTRFAKDWGVNWITVEKKSINGNVLEVLLKNRSESNRIYRLALMSSFNDRRTSIELDWSHEFGPGNTVMAVGIINAPDDRENWSLYAGAVEYHYPNPMACLRG